MARESAVTSLLTRVNQKSAQNTWLMVRQFVFQEVFLFYSDYFRYV